MSPSPLVAALPSPLQPLGPDPVLDRAGVRLLLKRDDLIHPRVPGNKWRKLHRNLDAARAAGARTLLTFGGAYSNHLRAVAAAARAEGMRAVGVVRGEELADRPLNPSLRRAAADGMELHFVSRAAYRAKGTPEVLDGLRYRFGPFFLLPEGGSNGAAVRGCAPLGAELAAQLGGEPALVCCAVGTGGTLAGIAAGLPAGWRALGVSALKGAEGHLESEVRRLQREAYGGARGGPWRIDHGHHHGGFARSTPELDVFAREFAECHGVALERVYVAKLLHAVVGLAARGGLGAPGPTAVAVVTGGPEPGAPG